MVAAAFPDTPSEQEKKCAYVFMLSLGSILPCEYCRVHYKAMLAELALSPDHFCSRDAFFRLVFDMHNKVNARLNKPQLPYAYIRDKYNELAEL